VYPSNIALQHVIASYTGSPVALLIAFDYGGNSVHSSKNALTNGYNVIVFLANLIIPGVTFSTSTFSPNFTASNPGTFWHPTITYLLSSKSTPQNSQMSFSIENNDLLFAVKIAIC